MSNKFLPSTGKGSYELSRVVTIQRAKHRVWIHEGMTLAELIQALENVPDQAIFDDFEFFSDDKHYIEFHYEEVIKDAINE